MLYMLIISVGLQVVTAVLLLQAIKRPLRKSSVSPGLVPNVRWRIPNAQALVRFLLYAGPICGVLVTKTVRIHLPCCPSVSFSGHEALAALLLCLCLIGLRIACCQEASVG